MTDAHQPTPEPAPAPPPAPPAPASVKRGWVLFALRSHEGRETFMQHAAVWDAPVYALVIAIGIPLMGWLSLGYSDHYATRVTIAWVWVMFSSAYWYIEVREILAQIRKYGVLQRDESDSQRSSMQSLYWGALVAFLAWAIPMIVYAATYFTGNQVIDFVPHYGVVEWGLIVYTVIVGRYAIKAIYALISEFQEALAFQRRREEQTASH